MELFMSLNSSLEADANDQESREEEEEEGSTQSVRGR